MIYKSGIELPKVQFSLLQYSLIEPGSYFIGFDLDNSGKLSKMDNSGVITVIESDITTPESLIPITYSEFYDLITSNSLVPTAKYKILDYRSANFLNGLRIANNPPPENQPEWDYYPQQVHYGEIEPIIVTASSTYEIEPIAYSDVYKDDIINYVPYTNKIAVNIELYNGDTFGTTGLNLQWDGTHVYFDMPANYPILYGHSLTIDLYNPVSHNSLGISFINIKIGTSLPNRVLYYSSTNGVDLTQSINGDITITNNNTRVIFENLTHVDFLNLEGNVYIYHVQEVSNSYGFISRREDTLNRVSVPFDYRGYKYRRYEMDITSIFPSFYDNNYIGTAPEVMFTDPITGDQTLITTTGNYHDYSVFSSVIDLQWNGVGTPDYYTFGTPVEYLVSRVDNNVFNCTLGDCIIDNCEVVENTITPQPNNSGFFNESVFKGNKIHFSFIQNIISGEFENNIINTKEGNTFNTENFAQNIIRGRVTGNNLSGRITLNHIVELKVSDLEYFQYNKINIVDAVNGRAISYNEGGTLRRVFIDRGFYNNTFLEITDTDINGDCNSNNVANIGYCKIGWYFQNNTIADGFNYNTIGDNFSDNTIGINFRNNHIGDYFGFKYIFELYYGPMPNIIGDNFAENHIKNNFYGNEIGDNFQNNNIDNYFDDNEIGDNFQNNNIDNYFDDNVIGIAFQSNTIQEGFSNNVTLGNFKFNNIGISFANNPSIGIDFSNNAIGNYFRNNTSIGYNFQYNNIGNNFEINIIGSQFENNIIANGFSQHTISNVFRFSSINGGNSSADSSGSVIAGGCGNTVSCSYSTVSGGCNNISSKKGSTVSGGIENTVSSFYSTINGGNTNTICDLLTDPSCLGYYSATGNLISGGSNNSINNSITTLSAYYGVGGNTISGGGFNSIVTTCSTYSCYDPNGYSTVSGGLYNTICSEMTSTIGGGYCNLIYLSQHSTIGGGCGHSISEGSCYATISGGRENVAADLHSSVVGGLSNTSSAISSIVGGGEANTASGRYSSILGGTYNTASGDWSTISGGCCNTVSCSYSTVSGGYCNTASNYFSTVSGGYRNCATGDRSIIGGGYYNIASSSHSTVSGGTTNTVSGDCSTISGGSNNTASGEYSAILGGKFNSTNSLSDAMIVGSNITADWACATFVNNLSIKNIPTSSVGLPSGAIWRDSANDNVLKIVP